MERTAVMACLVASLLIIGLFAFPMQDVPIRDRVYEKGDWKYQVLVLAGGTTARKTIRELTFRNKEVIGDVYHRITTDLGQFMWVSYDCEGSRCGWYKIDPKRKYPRWTRVKIDESEQGG